VPFLSRQPIRRQLLVAAFALALPLFAAVIWTANETRLDQQARVEEQAASVAVTAAAQLDSYVAGLDGMASAVARHPAVVSGDADGVARLFNDLLLSRPFVTNLVLVGRDGHVGAAATPLPPGYDRVAWAFLDDIFKTGEPAISDYATSPTTGRAVVALGYPVKSVDNDVAGVLVLGLDLIKLETVFASVPLPEGSVISVADRNGVVIARSAGANHFIGADSGSPRVSSGTAAQTSLRIGDDGVERFYGDVAARQGAWTVSVGIPRNVVPARLRPMWARNISILSFTLATMIGLGLLIAWQTTTHLSRLRNAAQRIAGGDLSPVHDAPTPNREFGELQDTFIQMAAKLREARDALDRQMDQERKMNEMLQSLQRQVVRQERLAAVGLLVSGVAHEVNNPLQGILGTAELLEQQPGLSKQALEEIAFLKTQAGRAREIIRNLSRFSSQQSGPPVLLDLNDVIKEVVELRKRDLDSARVALDVQVSSHRKVHANFTELEQVTLNFVINAQQAIEGAQILGRVLIRLVDVGKKVRLEVNDNGPGVKHEDEAKLFQPFFTTKPVGKGTGLGLSVSYGIIEAYGGTIGYSKNEWGGATFFFELPAAGTDSDHLNDRPAVLHGSI
jgi:C4-dicarboxylate-specific signal transduction histidine kinase